MADFDEISDVLDNLAKTLDVYTNSTPISAPKPTPPSVVFEIPEQKTPLAAFKSPSKELPTITLEEDEDIIPFYKPVESRKSSVVEAPKVLVEAPKSFENPKPPQKPPPPVQTKPKDFPKEEEEEPQLKLPSIAQSALEELQRELERMPSFDTFFKEKATPPQKVSSKATKSSAPPPKALVQVPKTIGNVGETSMTSSDPPVKKSKGKVDKVIKSDELDYIPEYEPPPPPRVPAPAPPIERQESKFEKNRKKFNESPEPPAVEAPKPPEERKLTLSTALEDIPPPIFEAPPVLTESPPSVPKNGYIPKARSDSLLPEISARLPPVETKSPIDVDIVSPPGTLRTVATVTTNTTSIPSPSLATPSTSKSPASLSPISSNTQSPIQTPSTKSPNNTPPGTVTKRYMPPSLNTETKASIDDIPPPLNSSSNSISLYLIYIAVDEIPPYVPKTGKYNVATLNHNSKFNYSTSPPTNSFMNLKANTLRPSATASGETSVWKEYTSTTTGKKYYYNTITKETSWNPPPGFNHSNSEPSTPPTVKARAVTHTNIFDLDPQRTSRQVRRPTDKMPQIILAMHFVDDTKKKFIVTEDFTIQDLIYLTADKWDLWQTDYFTVSAVNADDSDRWLKNFRTVAEERVTAQSKLVFKIKHFKTPKKLIDPAAIHLFYLQAYQNTIRGFYPFPEKVAVKLAAYQLQILYGDFSPAKHKLGFFDNKTIQSFLPLSIINSRPLESLERRIFSIYEKLRGIKAQEGEAKYLELAKLSPMYGYTFFDVTEGGFQRKLGISEEGFAVTKKDSKDTYDFYHFNEISGWNQTATGIQIRISNPDKKPQFDFVTSHGHNISELLSEYYVLLSDQIDLPTIPLPLQPSGIPDARLYLPPAQKATVDPNFSRLDMLKTSYLEECKAAKLEPSFRILFRIDEPLDTDQVMETLDLSKCKVDPLQLEALTKALPKATKYTPRIGQAFVENLVLRNVNLSLNPLGIDGATHIGHLIEEPSINLKSLNLKGIKLGPKGAHALASYLEKSKFIAELNFEENELTDKGATAIIEAIKYNRNVTLLNLASNGIQDEKVWALLGEHLKANGGMLSLTIGGNKIGESGIKSIIVGLRRATKSLENLDIHSGNFGTKATKEVIIWLGQNIQMKSLNIANNEFSDKAAEELVKVLRDGLHKLSKLDLKLCGIASKPLREICQAIGDNKRLEEITLSGNTIKKKTGQSLCESMEVNKALTTLGLRDCSLNKQTLVSLIKMVRKHPSIKHLDIALNTEVSNGEVARELEDLLVFGEKLEDLNIAACDLSGSSNAFQTIVSGVGKNGSLKKLHLDVNNIGKGIVKIAEAIGKNKHGKLETLTLKNADISKRDLHEFFKTLGNESALKTLVLERNELERTSFEEDLKQFPSLEVHF